MRGICRSRRTWRGRRHVVGAVSVSGGVYRFGHIGRPFPRPVVHTAQAPSVSHVQDKCGVGIAQPNAVRLYRFDFKAVEMIAFLEKPVGSAAASKSGFTKTVVAADS